MRSRFSLLLLGPVALAATVLAACAPPPDVATSSPFFGSAEIGPDEKAIAELLGCASGGGPVEAQVITPFDLDHPYLVQFWSGWDPSGPSLGSGHLAEPDDVVLSDPLPLGGCFRARITLPSSADQGPFQYTFRWCSDACTTTPTAPTISRFDAPGGPFVDPALVPLTWTYVDPNPYESRTCRIDAEGDGIWDLTITDCPTNGGRNVSLGAGTHSPKIEVDDGTFPPAAATTAVAVAPGPTEPFDLEVVTPAPLPTRLADLVPGVVARWEAVLARGVADQAVTVSPGDCGPVSPWSGTVDDIRVDIVVGPIDGNGGIAADAAGCKDGPDGLPRIGFVRVDEADVGVIPLAYLDDLVAHELGHALGFSGSRWATFARDLGTDTPTFVGPRALAALSELGGSGPVPLAAGWSLHWDEYRFGDELMTPGIGPGDPQPLSILTLGALADMGYAVDRSAAEPYTIPSH